MNIFQKISSSSMKNEIFLKTNSAMAESFILWQGKDPSCVSDSKMLINSQKY
jgi:hypothetical protein